MALPGRVMRAEYTHVVLPAPAGKDPKTDDGPRGVRRAAGAVDDRRGVLLRPEGLRRSRGGRTRSCAWCKVINFGIFDFLAVPLLRALKWIHGYIGNYGWAIIVLTLLINAVMFPLRHKSMVSMRKMQEIQPQVKAIQDRYGEAEGDRPRAAEDEHGDDGPLQGEGRQPGERLRADAAHVPDALRVLLAAVAGDRDPRRAVHLVDHGPLGARPVLRDADPDGRQPVLAAEDDAHRRRPGPAEDDDDDAARLHVHVPVDAERPDGLLVLQQPARDRPAVHHEPAWWARRTRRGRRPSGS